MPELPDVEVFKQYLDATALHQEIAAVDVRDPALLEDTSERDLETKLRGRRFEATHRHGKYLLVKLDTEGCLTLHFGMTGQLKYFKAMAKEPEYDRFLIDFTNGYHRAYDCLRKLGKIGWVADRQAFIEKKELGPDALQPDFDFETFREALAGRRGMIKSALMNQQLMAGIGNVYSDEILYQSGLHPKTKVDQLDQRSLETIFQAMKDVLQRAIEHRAEPAQFPDSWLTPRRDDGAECPRCGGQIEQLKVSGRSAYICPDCQTRPA